MKAVVLEAGRKKFAWFVLLCVALITFAGCSGGGGGGAFFPSTEKPAAPTGIHAVAVSTSTIRVTWTPVSGATAYNVYTSNTPTVDLISGNRMNGIVVTSMTFTDTSVLANSTYYYRVTAVNAHGESGGSNVASAATGSWNIQTAPGMNPTYYLRSVAWSGTEFTTVGDAGCVYTSPTGSDWADHSAPLTLSGMNKVRWVNGQYIAVAQYTGIYTSPTGSAWSVQFTSGNNIAYMGIAWSGSEYLVTGGSNTNSWGAQATSSNGTTWLASWATPTTGPLNDVVWSQPSGTSAKFVAAGIGGDGGYNYGVISTSTDGGTWTSRVITAFGERLRGITWSGSLYVAVGNLGAIYTSPDGGAWTKQESDTTLDLYAVTWTGKRFVAVGGAEFGGNAVITSSNDGINWVSQDPGTAAGITLYDIVWSGSNYVIVGSDATILSN